MNAGVLDPKPMKSVSTFYRHVRRRVIRAFSLLEMLLVLTVVAGLLAITANSGFFGVLDSTSLSDGGQRVIDMLNLGRQTALTQNRYVQVRFLYPTSSSGGAADHVEGMQLYIGNSPYYGSVDGLDETVYSNWLPGTGDGTFRGLSSVEWFPDPTVIVRDNEASPMLDALEADTTVVRRGSSIIGNQQYNWLAFYFGPDGGTDLQYLDSFGPEDSVVTLASGPVYDAQNGVPDNFVLVQVNPVNGRPRVARP